MKHEENIRFVARHYRRDAFDTRRALAAVIGRSGWWTPLRSAAAAILLIALGATATIIVRNNLAPASTEAVEQTILPADPIHVSSVIDFDATPLPDVVTRIEEVYGIQVTGLPSDASDMTLTLHYEGPADELIEAINETLGTRLDIKTED